MDLHTILSELRRLESLVEGWCSQEQISAIERDLALDKLKSLYEAVRFAEAAADGQPEAVSPRPIPTFPVAEEPSLSQAAASIPQEPMALEEEPAVIDFDDLMLVEEPPIEEAPILQEPMAEEPTVPIMPEEPLEEQVALPEPEPEPESEPAPEPEPCDESMQESPAEESQITESECTTEEPKSVEIEPVAEEPKAPVLQNSLFDMNEIPVHRRSSRRVLLSLYGEAPEPRSSKRKAKEQSKMEEPAAEPAKEVVEQTAPSTEPSPLAELVREEIGAPVAEASQEPSLPMHEDATDEEPIFREEEVVTELVTPQPAQEPAPILGEVMQADQQTLADTFAPKPTVASSLRNSGGSLKEHIALNDRYLLRKELFEDNEQAFHAAIEELDRMPSLDDCMIYIAENYTWNANSEAAKMLVELLEQKYGE